MNSEKTSKTTNHTTKKSNGSLLIKYFFAHFSTQNILVYKNLSKKKIQYINVIKFSINQK